jgi:hypothetical protein
MEYQMSDAERIAGLVKLASNQAQLIQAQHEAAQRLLKYDGEVFPHDGCAITLSVLLQRAGIDVPDTYRAIDLGNVLKGDRHWAPVPLGEQQVGDIGSTCGAVAQHGSDHIYLVLKLVNDDEMVVADNQAPGPHFRYASGIGGKTPTHFFLRAPGAPAAP